MGACVQTQTQVEKRETRVMGTTGDSTKRVEHGVTKVSPRLAHRYSSGLDLIAFVILSRSLLSQSETESAIAG
jgi:hypothetical protein